ISAIKVLPQPGHRRALIARRYSRFCAPMALRFPIFIVERRMSVVRPSVGPKKLLLAIASVALMCGYGTGFAATPTGNANSLATAPAGISYAALINKFTNHEWDNGSWRKSAGVSVQATAENLASFQVGASVVLADGQVRTITEVRKVGSNLTVLMDGPVLDGTLVGYPSRLSVLDPAAQQPALPEASRPPQEDARERISLVGVNLSGAGFGSSVLPGKHGTNYIYPAESYYQKYAGQGLNLVRLPFLWERIQPALDSELNAAELARLVQSLDFAHKYGVKVILDLHNYYRYYGKLIGSPEVPITSFADVWRRIAQQVGEHPAVSGYGLMNEPYGTNGLWPEAALAA